MKSCKLPSVSQSLFPRTIDDLFTLVETASRNAATLRVTYEPELGYPAYVYIDYDHAMVGEEVELRVVSVHTAE